MAKTLKQIRNLFRTTPKSVVWIVLICVIVVYCYLFYTNFVKPYSYRWKALYGETRYPKGTVRGIDVSHYQKTINWLKLKNAIIQDAPVDFVIIKATEGSLDLDNYFNYNFHSAKKQNIIRGAYHFFTTQSTGLNQAKFFCKNVKLEKGDLPPVLDLEIDINLSGDNYYKLKNEIIDWLSYVGKHYATKPIIYASYKFKEHFLNDKIFDEYPYWIAHYYVDSLSYNGNWTFWQHTDAGHVDGIDGYVDIDLFNGKKEELKNLCLK